MQFCYSIIVIVSSETVSDAQKHSQPPSAAPKNDMDALKPRNNVLRLNTPS